MSTPSDTVPRRRFERERAARQQAEDLLEEKSRELYLSNCALRDEKERVERRSDQIRKAHEELKAAHSQLVQSEKLAVVGQLAAGVAHEINNPIAFVLANLNSMAGYLTSLSEIYVQSRELVTRISTGESRLLADDVRDLRTLLDVADEDELLIELRDIVNESVEGTERVRDIVSGLRSFSRVDENEFAWIDVNQCLESVIRMLWPELKYRCEVVRDYHEISAIEGLEGKLNQVFLNIVANASQALAANGIITVASRESDGEIVVSIADNGEGISPDVMPTIFDPFYTTKPVGEGTGLGLAISQQLVAEHGGRIDVESEVGVGTTFKIVLPIRQAARSGVDAA
ncbi:MAG: ATP-binding protein [Pseudomonadota bacterium]